MDRKDVFIPKVPFVVLIFFFFFVKLKCIKKILKSMDKMYECALLVGYNIIVGTLKYKSQIILLIYHKVLQSTWVVFQIVRILEN